VKETSLKPAIQQEVRVVRGSGSKRRRPTEEEIPVFRGPGLVWKGLAVTAGVESATTAELH
jgi:hypothetical protein